MDQKSRKRLALSPGQVDRGALTLRELSAAAASGERAIFDEVHARLDAIVRRFMRDRGADAALSDDLSQRVWVAVWQACRAGKYDPSRAAISTFVYAVSSNVWLQHLRSRHAAKTRDARTEAIAALGVDISDAERVSDFVKTAEAIELVRQTLRAGASSDAEHANPGGLTAREIDALRATGEDVTDRDLALRLAVSPSTAHATRKSALSKLAGVLRRAGFFPDDAANGRVERAVGTGAKISQIPPSAVTRTANNTPRASS